MEDFDKASTLCLLWWVLVILQGDACHPLVAKPGMTFFPVLCIIPAMWTILILGDISGKPSATIEREQKETWM